jgi:multidrug resistance efflux pump
VLFAVDRADSESASPPDPRAALTGPFTQGGEPVGTLDNAPEVRAAARSSADSGQVRVYSTEKAAAFYDDQEKGSIIAVPVQATLQDQNAPRGVITLLIEPRSKQALQTTMAMVEVLAGYTNLHAVRQQLLRVRAASAALDLASKLIAAINTSTNFKGATIQLANDLSRQIRADRVAVGWVRGIGASGAVRCIAVSDTENIDRRMAMIQKIEAAMYECLDQEQPVLYPPPPSAGEQGAGKAGAAAGDVLLSQAITHAHRELGASDARLKVVSLPLRENDKVIGVVTVESTAEGPADIGSIELVQSALDLVSPVLNVKRSDDRMLASRAWISTVKGGAWLVGAKHTVWKLVGVLLLIAGITVTFVHVPYRVEAPLEVQARIKHTISVPFDGVIETLEPGVLPGKVVQKGEVLAHMETMQAAIQRADATAAITQYEKEADNYRNQRKQNEALQSEEKANQARAKLNEAEMNLTKAVITAPITGTIIAGDLSDKIGAAGKLGDPLFQIAPLNDMIVIARLSDRDIALIQDEVAAGENATRGEMATKAAPGKKVPIIVERIVPLAQAKDGKNAFEVRCRLVESAKQTEALRPGMEGFVKLDTGRRTLLDIGTRRIRDQLRLWLWW